MSPKKEKQACLEKKGEVRAAERKQEGPDSWYTIIQRPNQERGGETSRERKKRCKIRSSHGLMDEEFPEPPRRGELKK